MRHNKRYTFFQKTVDKWNTLVYYIFRRREMLSSGGQNGSIAQLGEHLPYKQRVTGSSPVVPTNFISSGAVFQSVRMPACHAGGRGFEPLPRRHFYALVAQSVEQ